MAIVAIDTNVLVALLDNRDVWHNAAIALRDALDREGAELVYLCGTRCITGGGVA